MNIRVETLDFEIAKGDALGAFVPSENRAGGRRRVS
jgi:hypothetical protein